MSRITNDTETISQAINFALLQVLGGVLLLVWIGYSMLRLSVPYALISLVAVPAMLLATFWFSSQARKAFRKARQDLGNVNAELQEGISAVREVQAFGREDENIQQFMHDQCREPRRQRQGRELHQRTGAHAGGAGLR